MTADKITTSAAGLRPARAGYRISLPVILVFLGLGAAAVIPVRADTAPQRLVGQWVHVTPPNFDFKMVYEFHADGTLAQYYTMSNPAHYPRQYSTKSLGSYRFQKGILTYRLTTFQYKGKPVKSGGGPPGLQKYKALLVGDHLRLTQILPRHNQPVFTYTRQ